MSEIFICYRADDDRFAALLVEDRLRAVFGHDNVFIDRAGVPAAVRDEAIAGCAVVLPLIGKHWVRLRGASGGRRIDDPADFVVAGLAAALAAGTRVLPVLLNGAPMPGGAELPPALRALTTCHPVRLRSRTSNADLAYLAEKVSFSVQEIEDRRLVIPNR